MSLEGQNVIITGGNGGIGKTTALYIASLGANVTIIGRNEQSCIETLAEIKESTANEKVDYKLVDLGSFSAINSFANEYKSSHSNLHILVNNAGVFSPIPTQTEQGIEATIGINYLGHFYLTHLLADILKPVKGRVIVVASEAYKGKKISSDMLEGKNPAIFKPVSKPGWVQYSQSNLCRVQFAGEIVNRHPDLLCVSLHPGFIKTGLGRNIGCCFKCLGICFVPCQKTPEKGAETTCHCATADIADFNGMYFKDCKQEPILEGYVSKELQEKLWQISMNVVEQYEASSK